MGGCYSIDGVVPVVHPGAFVHPDAVLIGDVVVETRSYVGPFASLRGDLGRIHVRSGANIQDSCVLHCFPGRDCVVEEDGHVGHGVVLHGCVVGRGALVGIGSVLMDGVRVGEYAFIGAHSFVRSDTQVLDGWLFLGSPARAVRPLTDDELAWKANGTAIYQQLARRSSASLERVSPLTELDSGRPLLPVGLESASPLQEYRAERG